MGKISKFGKWCTKPKKPTESELPVKGISFQMIKVKPWQLQQPPETKLLISVASVRGQNLACNVSFNMSYSLVL